MKKSAKPALPHLPDAPAQPAGPDALRLCRADMVGMESLLAAQLRHILPFATHSLYFPTAANTPDGPQWLPRERTLLLPLVRGGEVLGVFTARGADGRVARRLLPHLPALADLCLDNLELERRARSDALTGLSLTAGLLDRMAREADAVRQRFSGGGDEDMGPLHRVCMGLVVVRCRDWRHLALENGYAFADALTMALAQALSADLPPEAVAARIGEDEFAVLLPAGSRGACRKLSAALLPRLDAVHLPHPGTGARVHACCAVGHALYPQDMDATLLRLPMQEQARVLLHKARLAATAAQERFDALADALASQPAETLKDTFDAARSREARSMGYGQVLTEGGAIRRVMPLGRVEVSLGRHMGAYEGLRFAVWTPAGTTGTGGSTKAEATRRCKGEIVLADVREHASVADVLHWADPADPQGAPDVGDTLTLLPQGHAARTLTAPGAPDLAELPDLAEEPGGLPSPTPTLTATDGAHPASARPEAFPPSPAPHLHAALLDAAPSMITDAAPTLLRHGDFVRLLGRQCEGRAAFTLALVRLEEGLPSPGISSGASSPEASAPAVTAAQGIESRMAQLHQLCRRRWEAEGHPAPVLAARYGQTSLIFLHAATPADTKTAPADAASRLWPDFYAGLCHEAAAESLPIAVGLASWPNLRFTRADMPECCRKALDLALLLPAPRVGQFGSLALNISADKRYSRGDIFGAVEEYKQALLADSHNSMAWNSLGVCMAALSRQQEARGHFLKALHGWKRALARPERPPFLPADTTLEAEYAATLYNLGTVCQSLGERRAAARYYRLCVHMQPGHYFAHLRLGQLAEEGGRRAQARTHYQQAAQLEEEGRQGHGMALRQLARLAARSRKPQEARDLLHEALRRDPQDAAAMALLAELCLGGKEDADMAEMLARKCVRLRGNHAPSWRLLARALRALDRHAEADSAEARAEAL